MSKRPVLLVIEYELDDDIPNHFDAAFEMLRQSITALPPLGQPFNITVFADELADRISRAAFERDCLPPGQTVEGRSGEAP
jgi:hypothetical protein